MKKIFKFIIFLLIIGIIAIVVLYFVNRNEDNAIGNFITGEYKREVETDNRNGIYIYEEKLDKHIKVSSGCTLVEYEYHLVVVNKTWYRYKKTCLGTYQLESGNVEDLKINYNSEKKEYSIVYKDNKYIKNDNYISIYPYSNFEKSSQYVYLTGYKTLVNETMFDGYRYGIDRGISGLPGDYKFQLTTLRDTDSFNMCLPIAEDGDKNATYCYNGVDINEFPDLIPINKYVGIREKYFHNGRNNYNLKMYSFKKGIFYDMNNVFPITVNGVTLSPDTHYIYVDNNENRDYYMLLVGNQETMCVEGSESDDVAYYEFKIEIDYLNYEFKTPSFVRTWFEREGCSHAKEIMGG